MGSAVCPPGRRSRHNQGGNDTRGDIVSEPIKLNLGSGAKPLEGWVNIDIQDGRSAYPLSEYADESVDEVRASHLLEHFGHREAAKVLAEWVRVLKPGGKLWIAVPDFHLVARAYLDGKRMPVQQYLMGGQVDEHDYHHTLWDEELLREAMEAVGLVRIDRWESDAEDCASLPVSLNLVGEKPKPDERPTTIAALADRIGAEVAAVMSMPRLAFTDNMFCAFEACAPLGIRITRSSGVFWGQCLTGMIEDAIKDGFRYVLTIDYDTVFQPSDVLELYKLMEEHPEVDAVCAMQIKRSDDHVLMTIANEDGSAKTEIEYSAMERELLRITTGHFGLTMLRCAAFADLARPWFHSVPDQDGRWRGPEIVNGKPVGGRMDEDIAFWARWRDAGKTLYQANHVVIGHMQLVVTWPGEDLKPVHQYITDYHKRGKPRSGIWS